MIRKNSIVIELKKTDIKEISKPVRIIIIFDYLFKITFFYKKEKKTKEKKNDLNFRIVDEKGERIKRFINVICRRSFS